MRNEIKDWFNQKAVYNDSAIIYFNVYVIQQKLNVEKQQGLIENTIKEADSLIYEVRKIANEASKILSNLQDKISSKVISEAENTFKGLQIQHKDYEFYWFIAFIGSLISLFISIGISIFYYSIPEDVSTLKITRYFLEKAVLIFLPSVLSKITLTKYQTERHLNVLYAHRSAVLSQYKEFENVITDSQEKNQFRLEIAKYLFSDPQTGYIKDSSNSDLSFNPIISIIERIGSSKSTQ